MTEINKHAKQEKHKKIVISEAEVDVIILRFELKKQKRRLG